MHPLFFHALQSSGVCAFLWRQQNPSSSLGCLPPFTVAGKQLPPSHLCLHCSSLLFTLCSLALAHHAPNSCSIMERAGASTTKLCHTALFDSPPWLPSSWLPGFAGMPAIVAIQLSSLKSQSGFWIKSQPGQLSEIVVKLQDKFARFRLWLSSSVWQAAIIVQWSGLNFYKHLYTETELLWHDIKHILHLYHLGTFSQIPYNTSFIDDIIPQDIVILPQKCLTLSGLLSGKRKTIVSLTWGHTTRQSSSELCLPFACSFSCWCAQLVLSQETGNLGERPPSIPRFPVDCCEAPWPQGQETLHLSQYNSHCLGPVEYGPIRLYTSSSLCTHELISWLAYLYLLISDV